MHKLTFKLKDGYYSNIKTLLQTLQNILANAKEDRHILLQHDDITNRVVLKITDDTSITFSQNILNILGLGRREGHFYTRGIYSENTADITEGFNALYIYSNIVKTTLVGDSLVPLLRVIPYKTSKQTHRAQTFQHVQYQPVHQTQTDIIEINIRRDNGGIVPFAGGKVILTLHFRELQ